MKKSLLLILGLLLTTSLFAGPVGKEEAKAKALAFLNGTVSQRAGVAKAPRRLQDLSLASSGDAYHVFNIGASNGFVIVSGSDLTPDIIGYTDEGAFDAQNIPDNMKEWLQEYTNQIAWMEKQGEATASASKVRKAPAGVKAAIAPLIQTKWNQVAPYNYQVPSGCATGCVASAMAQMLYYCNQKEGFPMGTIADIAGYNDGNGHDVSACTKASFDWANMQKTYTGSELTTAPEAVAVATLMQYCGAAVRMRYASTSSATTMFVSEALNTYFGFDHHLKNLYRNLYTNTEWEDIIYQELAANRPVLYGGKSSGGGHAFICDGYDADGYFHINWGWGGLHDGYYLLSVVNPEKGGAGSGSAVDGYAMKQDAIIGFQKSTGDTTPEAAVVSCQQFDYLGTATVAKNQTNFQFDFTTHVKSELTFTHTFVFGVGVYDDEDHLVGEIKEYTGAFEFPPSGASDITYRVYLNLKSLTAGKTYTLKQMSRLSSSSDWNVCYGSDAYYVQAVVDESDVTFTTVSPNYNLTASDITLTTDGVVNTAQTITAKIKNTGTAPYRSILYLIVDGEKKSGTDVNVEPGESVLASFSYKPTVAGTQILQFTTDESGLKPISGGKSIKIESGVPSDNTPTLTSVHQLNVSGMEILGKKLVDKVRFTNESPTTAYDGWVSTTVYKWTGSSGSPTTLESQHVIIPPSSSVVVTFEKDVEFDGTYSVRARYYHGGSWADALPDVAFTKYTVTPAITTIAADGTETLLKAAASYNVPADAAVVDLRGQSVVTSLVTTAASPNCLYLADTDPISGITKNWVKGTTAANIELTDGYDFYTPIDFTATKISYTRKFSKGADGSGNGWSTIILPFDVDASTGGVKNGSTPIRWFTSSSDTDKDFWVYKFITDGKGTVKFDHAGNIMKANTPYLITMPSDHWGVEYKLTGTPITFEATDAVIKSNEKNTQSGFYYMFTGGSQKQSVTDAYVLNDEGNKFKTTASGTVPAFQAYFYPSSHNLQADALAIGFVGHDEATGIVELTTDDVQESVDDAWYTINGVKLTGKPTEKGVYIHNGRKYIIQ